jgi:hypothetical protein
MPLKPTQFSPQDKLTSYFWRANSCAIPTGRGAQRRNCTPKLNHPCNTNAPGDVVKDSTDSGSDNTFDSRKGQQLDIVSRDGCVIFQIRVQPRASRDEIAGVIDGSLKVRIKAPAVENRANEAVCEYLAMLLKTSKSAVRILGGERSRVKRVEVRGVQPRDVLALISHEA